MINANNGQLIKPVEIFSNGNHFSPAIPQLRWCVTRNLEKQKTISPKTVI